jgi:hypothetical protein
VVVAAVADAVKVTVVAIAIITVATLCNVRLLWREIILKFHKLYKITQPYHYLSTIAES